ncbi:hypothetical protein BC829DRAFT_407757 [Chytridium lagenaria]|nr:hypothetical protein BC829DRAFT_407757 [Chytridium lagenaria]
MQVYVYFIIVAAVAVFLAVGAALIYKCLRRKGVISDPELNPNYNPYKDRSTDASVLTGSTAAAGNVMGYKIERARREEAMERAEAEKPQRRRPRND